MQFILVSLTVGFFYSRLRGNVLVKVTRDSGVTRQIMLSSLHIAGPVIVIA